MTFNPVSSSIWTAENIQMRVYQSSIVERARKEHLLVVIPTGLGKTLIGAKLIQFCLEDSHLSQKAVFLAPTKPLVDQHFQALRNYFDITWISIHAITGEIKPKERIKIATTTGSSILIMTPQTLNNDLQKGRYNLGNVCLIIFDEAHRAQGGYAYVPIAQQFMNDNPSGRILALTASPGSSQEKIRQLLANLQIPPENIEYRDRQHREVKPYTHEIKVTPVPVRMTEIMEQTYKTLLDMKRESLEKYIPIYCELDPTAPTDPDRYYLSVIIKQMHFLTSQINHKDTAPNRNPRTLRILLSMNARINKIYHLLEYVESQGLENVFKALEKMEQKIRKGTASHADTFLFRDGRIQVLYHNLSVYRVHNCEELIHPKQIELKTIVAGTLMKNPLARILVFTKYRDTVSALVKYLKKEVRMCRPAKFVGQSSKSKSDGGMTQKKQLLILEKFRSGDINVLIATNVAEEGLDIAECNLVVMYDTLASEIRMIQRAGRTGRSSAGEIKILFTVGTADERKWYISQARKKKMKRECSARSSANIPDDSKYHDNKQVDNPESKLDQFLGVKSQKPKKIEPIYPFIDYSNTKIRPLLKSLEISDGLQFNPSLKFDAVIHPTPQKTVGVDFIPLLSFALPQTAKRIIPELVEKRDEVDEFYVICDSQSVPIHIREELKRMLSGAMKKLGIIICFYSCVKEEMELIGSILLK